MACEILGILHWNEYSDLRPKSFEEVEPEFIAHCAKVHEDAGFDRVLIANSAHRPDSLPIATWAAAATTKLAFMIAHRPGFIAPTMAARMFAILDRMSGGRCGVHIITGADDIEMQADGDFLTKDVRYRRSHEYVDVMRRVWSSAEPFDHDGEFYQAKGAFAHVRPTSGHIATFWGGSSPVAVEHGAQVADVYALPAVGVGQVRGMIADVRAAAARYGRTLDFLISTRVLVADTEAQAWERAHAMQRRLMEEVVDNGRFLTLPGETRSQAIERGLADANRNSLDGRMWSGVSRVPTGRPSINSLIGSIDQVFEALMAYGAQGISRFILSGYEPIEDTRYLGQSLIPRLREAFA
ncbi:LLM class flavin-dependent oxidoreductase [Novosphingobium gossypii]|uniref:LLM class flavin-dependent oxidoreductase n=1 Tax=Novosphingobium gossypii TaxID=1604774 RepID=UPI003D24CB91